MPDAFDPPAPAKPAFLPIAWLPALVLTALAGIGFVNAGAPLSAQVPNSAAKATVPQSPGQLFAMHCSGCHGPEGMGAVGPSLMAAELKYGKDQDSLARSVRDGHPERGMPGFGSALPDESIRSLATFLVSQRDAAASGRAAKNAPFVVVPVDGNLPKGIVHSDAASFRVESFAKLNPAFGIAFLPDGRILATETAGAIRVIDHGRVLPEPIAGAPAPTETNDVFKRKYYDISLHPDYQKNGWIYLLHSAAKADTWPIEAPVTLSRGRIRDGKWVDNQDLLTVRSELSSSARMAWDRQGFLYFGTSDSVNFWTGVPEKSEPQDLSQTKGKILRMTDDGKVPPDNPFVSVPNAFPYTWSYGHRVPVGLAIDQQGELWESENGPQGGDEINHIRRGRNYGWPVVTWGHPYDTDRRPWLGHPTGAGMEQPIVSFAPSPAMGGLAIYTGKAFPRWKDNLFVGSLKAGDLMRIVVDGDREVLRETILHKIGRVRDIDAGPDGRLYVLLDDGTLLRLSPAR